MKKNELSSVVLYILGFKIVTRVSYNTEGIWNMCGGVLSGTLFS